MASADSHCRLVLPYRTALDDWKVDQNRLEVVRWIDRTMRNGCCCGSSRESCRFNDHLSRDAAWFFFELERWCDQWVRGKCCSASSPRGGCLPHIPFPGAHPMSSDMERNWDEIDRWADRWLRDCCKEICPYGTDLPHTTDLRCHYDACTLFSTHDDGDLVSNWADQSSNGLDMSEADVNLKPTYRTNVVNGFPALEFTRGGSSDRLSRSNTSISPTSGLWTVFAVASCEQVAADGRGNSFTIFNNDGKTDRVGQLIRVAIDLSYHRAVAFDTSVNNYEDDSGEVVADQTFTIFSVVRDTSTIEAFTNGNSDGSTAVSGTPETGGNSPLAIGVTARHLEDFLIDGNPHNGYIAEIIGYEAALTSSQRAGVESYLATRYGISI